MLKSHEKSFSNLQKVLDIIVVLLSWASAYFIRFNFIPNAELGLELLFIKLSPILCVITLYSFYKNDLYKSQRFSHRYKEVLSVINANFIGSTSFVLLIYFFGADRLSRLTLGLYFLISTFALIAMRIIVRNTLRSFRKKGKNLRHVLLVGNGEPLKKYIESVRFYKDSGINFLAWRDSEGLANGSKIPEESSERPDAVIISYKNKDSYKIEEFLSDHYNDVVPIQILPDFSYSLIGHQIEDFGGIPLISVNQPAQKSLELFLKRGLDFAGSFLGLIVISPLLILISLLVKLTSKGPIFYAQERLGLNGGTFQMWKFRTMKETVDDVDQTEWSNKENPRKTKFGSFLRKTSLDELPQLWNVLKGEMSLVGPRPERPFFVEKFRREIPGYMLRHKMRAGITGWAQINGWRGDTSLEKRIDCDIYYIKHWSFWFDIKILLLTFIKGFSDKNAY
ncbi:MAG: undecaprenyl-phosphate glucose phosphotransferase [Bacteriovoracaceae bacterium]|nr:undecaprenyl-phosphate glucose phosphotransferase [Bacteriovoracaceae bacterium]